MAFKKILAAVVCSGLSCVSAAADQVINIAYIPLPFNLQAMVMKDQRLLEKEFASDGVEIRWHNLNTGPKQTKAMAAGSLDISPGMNSPATLIANSENNPVRIVGASSEPLGMYAIVSAPGQELSVQQLKGKTIAGPKGTLLHQLLASALDKNGLSIKDVNFVNLDIPKSLAALLAGKVDAALLASSALIKAQASGAKTIATADGHITPLMMVTASDKFASERPEWLARVVKVNKEALRWIKNNPQQAAELGAQLHGISVENAKKLAQMSNYIDRLEKRHIQTIKADQAFLLSNDITRNRVEVDSIFHPMAFE